MEFSLFWKAVMVVIGGTLLLRLAGRKSISQMSLAQVVIMIGLGSLLVQPIAGEELWVTLIVGLILVLTLIVIEYLQVASNPIERFVTGHSKVIIDNGVLQVDRLKRLRMTVDQLEMKLRQQSVTDINDVQYATLEPNGQIGVELKRPKQPSTKEDYDELMAEIAGLKQQLAQLGSQSSIKPSLTGQAMKKDIFAEVAQKGSLEQPPDNLQ
ncbi:DUF421 domain-containing protein [Thalassobacillus pellis]|uniref:DUF421 domain-containing protein n=1 Tax=Thalassobacillus pellis TaxID=748008 RepID=UPI00195FCF62|nr:DUF421 domain-containing protein [Thalassobacillus pellis]MBM7554237.1 uncharacterized membrane protein YcaP (DUF421 family) [Thalassobacillus pellis]